MAQDQATGGRLQLMKQGHPFNFTLMQAPKPSPGPGEVLVHLKAIAFNPLDWKQALHGLLIDKWPTVLGSEGAGVIEAVGDEVTDFKVGDEILALFRSGVERSAGYQEYAATATWAMSKKPAALSFETAASLPIGFGTAVANMHIALGISVPFLKDSKGEGFTPRSILVLGGSSAVGGAALQILRLVLPDTLIFTTCSPQHHDNAVALGASKAFDSRSADLLQELRSSSPGGKGVEAIMDCVDGVFSRPELLEILTGPKRFGQVPTGKSVERVPEGVKHKAIGMYDILGVPGGRNLGEALTGLLAEGKYRPPIRVEVAGTGLEALEVGLERLWKGVSGVKVVVSV